MKHNTKEYGDLIKKVVQDMLNLQAENFKEIAKEKDCNFPLYIDITSAFFLARICEVATKSRIAHHPETKFDVRVLMRGQLKEIILLAKDFIEQVEIEIIEQNNAPKH